MNITEHTMKDFLSGTGISENEWGDIRSSHTFEWEEFRPLFREDKHRTLENRVFYVTSFEINSFGEIERDIPPQMTYGTIGGRYQRTFYFAKSGKQGHKLKSTIALLNPRGYELIVCESIEQAEKAYNHLLTLANKKLKQIMGELEIKIEEISLKKIN